jgi:4'-phosphopantetheinyl transferase
MKTAWPAPIEPVALSDSKLDVWAIRLDADPAPVEELAAMLAADERQRAEQFRLEEPRRRFIITRAALRTLLGRYFDSPANSIAIVNDRNGKPRLANRPVVADVHFNVAHSGSCALITVAAGCHVGVDVEHVRLVNHANHIARRYFHPAEAEAVLAAAPSTRDVLFLRVWTGKEAVLKAVGSGITGSLASFRVPTNDFGAAWIDLPSQLSNNHERCWLHALAPCQGYIGAVAGLGEERLLRCHTFEW